MRAMNIKMFATIIAFILSTSSSLKKANAQNKIRHVENPIRLTQQKVLLLTINPE